jgi:hypothetical protein
MEKLSLNRGGFKMTKLLSISLVLIASMLITTVSIFVPVAAAGETQLIYQAGMEFGSSLFSDTILWQQGAGSYVTGSDAINGSRSFKFTPTVATWTILGGSSVGDFAMDDGGIYTIAMKYRSTDIFHLHMAQHNNGNWARDSFLQIDAGYGNTLDSQNILSSYYQDCGTYKYIEYSFTATNGPNTYFQLEAKVLSATASLTIDDFSIFAGQNVPSYERPNGQQLIAGSSFESGFGAYQTRYDSALLGTIDDSTARLIGRTSEVLNGNKSVKAGYPNTFVDAWAGLLTTPLTSAPGWQSYTVKFRAKVLQTTTHFFYLMLDAPGTAQDMFIGMDNNLQATWMDKLVNISQYKVENDGAGKIVTVTFVLDYAASFDSFFIGAYGGGYLSIDDIALYKGSTAPSYSAAAPVTSNTAPSIDPTTVSFSVNPGETYNGTVNVTDPEDSTFTYTYDSLTAKGTMTVAPDGKSFSYVANIDAVGTEQITISVNDGYTTTNFTANVTFNVVQPIMKGDVNQDNKISISDLITLKKHLVTLITLTGDGLAAADVDGINGVTVADLGLIKSHMLNIQLIVN